MSAKKKGTSKRKPATVSPQWEKLIRLLGGRGRPVVLVVLIVALFGGLWYAVWRRVGEEVLSSERYWLRPENVRITPLPEWVHRDVRAQVFRDASLDVPLSIMDPDLTDRIADAFSMHPWIAKVRRVAKSHPARVEVELVYRRPVCMVQVPGGLLPVDAEGVLLPSGDFSPIEAGRYPRLVGVQTVPVGPVGTRWGDARVVGGAEIAATFGPVWGQLGLDRVVASTLVEVGHRDEFLYELYTRGGTRILWGRAPGTDMPGELPAVDKVARLKKYETEHGTLEGPGGPQQLDVRNLVSPPVAPHTAGKPKTGPR